jgi:KDO2-lipid IV(A) lauroyltransferase
MGNWDAAGHFLCANGYRLAAVAEHLRPRQIFDQFLRHREALGMQIVPLTADKRTGIEVATFLADNWLVALVADRDLGGRGVDVEMFGATRKLPAGPALLSIRTGSPLMACVVYTTDEGWFCRIGVPLDIERTRETRKDVTALTTLLARQFERDIAAKPVDWHMFQPAW